MTHTHWPLRNNDTHALAVRMLERTHAMPPCLCPSVDQCADYLKSTKSYTFLHRCQVDSSFGVLATERDSVSTYSRNYKHEKGAFALQQYAGRSAQAQRANPGRENKAMHDKGDSQLGRIGVQSGFILREGRARPKMVRGGLESLWKVYSRRL